MKLTPSVRVESLPEYNTLKMIWHAPVNKAEIALALDELMAALEQADRPAYVLVTLKGDSHVPFGFTLSQTLRDSCRHPMVVEMLVCGESASASTISRRLTLLAGHSVVRNFPTEREAMTYLAAHRHQA